MKEGKEKKIIKPHDHIVTKNKIASISKQNSIEEEKLGFHNIEVKAQNEEKKIEWESVQTSSNPFKMFFNNIGDKSREIANSVIKEKDEFLSKFNNSKSPTSIQENNLSFTSCKDPNSKETQTDYSNSKDDNSINLK